MLIRKFQLLIAANLLYLTVSQNARSYDENDWIPVTKKSIDDTTKKAATGRVLNLDSPAQKFFPDEFQYKQTRPNFQSRPKQKDRYNVPKYENTYKFELPSTHPQAGGPKFQYYPQEVKLPNYQQPPPLEVYRPPAPRPQYVQDPQIMRAPPPNQPITYQQYTIPSYNTTFYQTISPVTINQELLSNVQYQNVKEGQGRPYLGTTPLPAGSANAETDNVQLVYVPLENLKGNQQVQSIQSIGNVQNLPSISNVQNLPPAGNVQNLQALNKIQALPQISNIQNIQPVPQGTQNIYRQIESPKYENFDKQRLAAIEQDFIQQALQATKLQEQIQQGEPLYYEIPTTTPQSIKKKKPHQPPLAVYLEGEKQQADLSDVLDALKDAKSIVVQDNIQPDSPQIFIGPSTLESPEYSKFPLPYLNTIDGNRINRNVDSLPFFVAPLSFKAPPGYSKIPLPAPHVGSILVSNKDDHGKRSTPRPNQFQSDSIKQQGKDDIVPVTVKPSSTETLTPQPYLGQNYYEQPPHYSSPEPQLLDYAVNDQIKQYEYNPQVVATDYNVSPQPQPEVTTQENRRLPVKQNTPESVYQYSFVDETSKPNKQPYSQPTESSEEVYSPSKSFSYTGPQVYDPVDEVKPTPNYQYSDYQKQTQDQYRSPQQVRYEPISTTFDSSPRKQQEVSQRQKEPQTTEKPRINDFVPLELAINDYELHQINTQLEERPKIRTQQNYKSQNSDQEDYKFDPELHRFAGTPASILRDSYVETTVRTTTKPRSRIRTRPPKTTTSPPAEVESYTVQKSFSSPRQNPEEQYIRNNNVPNPYRGTVTEIENIPSKVYDVKSKSPVYTEAPSVEYGYTLDQKLMDQQILQSDTRQNTPAYEQHEQQGQFEVSLNRDQKLRDQQSDIGQNTPRYEQHEQQGQFEVSPHQDQKLRNQQILQSDIRQNTPRYEQHEQQGQFEVSPHQDTFQSHKGSTREQVVEYPQDTSNNQQNNLLEYPYSLEDPSVRTLLVPHLLVPTTTNEATYTGPTYLPTTEKIRSTTTITTTTTTTERPIETTTQIRTRSRTRGGSRFNTVSTTKRSVNRRRPTSRTTTERTRSIQDPEYNQKVTSSKQRFRTRGRTTPNSITERQSTTEHEIHQESSTLAPAPAPVNIRTHPDGSQSYMEYEHSVQPQKVLLSESSQEEYPTTSGPILQYDNTGSTIRPAINVQVTHPGEEDVSREKVRVRGRIRDRTRLSTTTEQVVTRRTSRPEPIKESSEEEFYGFFRKPNFAAPAEPTTTLTPSRVYAYQTPSQHGEDYQYNLDNVHVETSTVRFVGEIVPKYTTSKEVITETETPKPRIRTRTRAPLRKQQQTQQQEQNTRRSNIIRSRGKTHYKLPDNLKKNKEENDDDDVEGGNYPQSFLQGRQGITTPSPKFQITVAPEVEDQDLNPSLYQPSVVNVEQWHDASKYDPEEERKTDANLLEVEEVKQDQPNQEDSDQPYALPVRAITTEKIESATNDEAFKETTRQIEEQFEAINNFDTKKQPPKKHRKGVWKLVKHRPVDRLETSESQNYFSVLNSYHDIKKVNGETKVEQKDNANQYFEENVDEETTDAVKAHSIDSTTILPEEESFTTMAVQVTTNGNAESKKPEQEEDFLESLYEMFGVTRNHEEVSSSLPPTTETNQIVTTTLTPTFPEELTELPSTSSTVNTVNTTEVPIETTTFPLEDFFTTPQIDAKHEMKTSTFDVLPWDMKEVRTSTSTEVSHETEICYKGRCIRSQDRKKRL